MGMGVRCLVVVGVVLLSFLMRWFVPNFIAREPMKELCRRIFGVWPETPSFGRLLRLLGWDICSATLGLTVIAYVFKGSNLRLICASHTAAYATIFALACFTIYFLLYATAIECRYIMLESAERVCRGQAWCGLSLWVLGLVALLYSSWLLAGS
jgi:hypothetical protein